MATAVSEASKMVNAVIRRKNTLVDMRRLVKKKSNLLEFLYSYVRLIVLNWNEFEINLKINALELFNSFIFINSQFFKLLLDLMREKKR